MTNQHPITPPDELVEQWREEWEALPRRYPETCQFRYIATQAAQWGADQELKACCHEVQDMYSGGSRLRAKRRPKPPSLKEQALGQLRASMTTNQFSEFNAKPPGELNLGEVTIATATTVSARAEHTMPVGYRLVTKDDGNGNTIPVLQGYFTWTQGLNRRGGEWRDLETQESLYAEDYVPFGPLFSNNSKGSVE